MSYHFLDTRGIDRVYKRGVHKATARGVLNPPTHVTMSYLFSDTRGTARDYRRGGWLNLSLPVSYHVLDTRGIVRAYTEEGYGSALAYP